MGNVGLMLAAPLSSFQLFSHVLDSVRVETLVLLSQITAAALLVLGAFETVGASLRARTASSFEQKRFKGGRSSQTVNFPPSIEVASSRRFVATSFF